MIFLSFVFAKITLILGALFFTFNYMFYIVASTVVYFELIKGNEELFDFYEAKILYIEKEYEKSLKILLNILNKIFSRSTFRNCFDNGYDKTYSQVVRRYVDNGTGKQNSELISQIYNVLREGYRNEYYYKNTLLNKLLLGIHSVNTTTALTEIPIAKSKADFVLINGKAVVYEIKSFYPVDENPKKFKFDLIILIVLII